MLPSVSLPFFFIAVIAGLWISKYRIRRSTIFTGDLKHIIRNVREVAKMPAAFACKMNFMQVFKRCLFSAIAAPDFRKRQLRAESALFPTTLAAYVKESGVTSPTRFGRITFWLVQCSLFQLQIARYDFFMDVTALYSLFDFLRSRLKMERIVYKCIEKSIAVVVRQLHGQVLITSAD